MRSSNQQNPGNEADGRTTHSKSKNFNFFAKNFAKILDRMLFITYNI